MAPYAGDERMIIAEKRETQCSQNSKARHAPARSSKR
jgi:hypothetical protein